MKKPMQLSFSKCAGLSIVVALFSVNAFAIPVEWTISNLHDEYGHSTTGSFTYDADLDIYDISNITITYGNYINTAGDPTLYNLSSHNSSQAGPASNSQFLRIEGTSGYSQGYGYPPSLILNTIQWAAPLTNAGGNVLIDAATFLCLTACVGSINYDPRPSEIDYYSHNIIEGEGGQYLEPEITGVVPVPAAVWLFGSALGGLGWMRRRNSA